jgi:hypothetical protein
MAAVETSHQSFNLKLPESTGRHVMDAVMDLTGQFQLTPPGGGA